MATLPPIGTRLADPPVTSAIPDVQNAGKVAVDKVFNRASAAAQSSLQSVGSFVADMSSLLYTPPTANIQWQSIAPPSLPAIPAPPVLPQITPAPISTPGVFSQTLPSISPPNLGSLTAPNIEFGSPPALNFPAAPTVPELGTVSVPEAPSLSFPAPPAELALQTVTMSELDLREDWLDRLEDVPTLQLLEPQRFSFSRPEGYVSEIMTYIRARMQGGTGLRPEVEQAIWDRARDKETQAALANEQEVMRQSERQGFALPTGTLSAQLSEVRQNYYAKLGELSRDIGIKQAELEQQNLRDSIQFGVQLEAQLMDQAVKMQQIAFDAAKEAASNAVAVYNAGVDRFKALLSGYQTYASVYKDIIQAQLAKVEIFKAQLDAEKTKANINKTRVDTYKAQIDAGLAQVEIYRAQVSGAQALIQLEQAKISAAGERIRAFATQINAETAKIDAYKAEVSGKAAQADVFRSQVQAFAAQAQVMAEHSRVQLAQYTAAAQANAAEWEGYRARVAAEGERIRALGMQSAAALDGYKAATASIVAQAEMQTKVWETSIKQYEAQQNYSFTVQKMNLESLQASKDARLDAAKTAAQIYAQLTASAYGMINANASVGQSESVNYSMTRSTSGILG